MRKSAVAALLPLVTTTFLTLPSLANELVISNLLQREDIKSFLSRCALRPPCSARLDPSLAIDSWLHRRRSAMTHALRF